MIKTTNVSARHRYTFAQRRIYEANLGLRTCWNQSITAANTSESQTGFLDLGGSWMSVTTFLHSAPRLLRQLATEVVRPILAYNGAEQAITSNH